MQCFEFINGWNVDWMAVYNGNTGTGTAAYYTNGTLATFDLQGVLVNAGTWSVEQVLAGGGAGHSQLQAPARSASLGLPCVARGFFCVYA